MRELCETGAVVAAETGLLDDAQRTLGTTPAPAPTQNLGRSAPMRAAALARSPAYRHALRTRAGHHAAGRLGARRAAGDPLNPRML